jgi:hypothetical protein
MVIKSRKVKLTEHVWEKKCVGLYKMLENDRVGDLGVEGQSSVKWDKYAVRVWTLPIWVKVAPGTVYWQHGRN